jgi:hypothetical protein
MPDVGLRNQVKTAAISFTTTGDNTIIAAVAGKLITVISLLLVSTGTTNITIKDGANLLSGAMPLAAGIPLILSPDATLDYFATTSGTNNFVLNQSGAVQISGTVWYLQY